MIQGQLSFLQKVIAFIRFSFFFLFFFLLQTLKSVSSSALVRYSNEVLNDLIMISILPVASVR
jgi:hypothetical protein